MKFSTKEDIEAPIDAVFEMLCDFDAYERAALRRGAEVQRTDSLTKPAVGMSWAASFDLRGKRRDVKIEMITFDRPNEMAAESLSQGMNGVMTLELMALSPNRTRVIVGFEIRPQNLSARLFVQSLKLAKGTLTTRYKKRVADHAKTLEERYKAVV